MKDHLKSFILEQKSKRNNFITDIKQQPFLMEKLLLYLVEFCDIAEKFFQITRTVTAKSFYIKKFSVIVDFGV